MRNPPREDRPRNSRGYAAGALEQSRWRNNSGPGPEPEDPCSPLLLRVKVQPLSQRHPRTLNGGKTVSSRGYGVFILKLILSYLPVHLISPHFNLPDTHIKHFFPLYQWEYPAACHVRLAPTRRQPWYHTPSPSILNSSLRGECGEDGREHIRWTGKYDNISFRIKTPYWHT